MSADSKKKRGESGAKNAKSIAFRYHGAPHGYSISTHIGNSNHFAGARFLHAMILGATLPNFHPSDRMYMAADDVMDRVDRRGHKKEKTND